MKERLRSTEQHSRIIKIEIGGLPETPNGNIRDIVTDVGAALGLKFCGWWGDHSAQSAVLWQERTPSIVVQFQCKDTKETCIQNFKQKKTLTALEVNSAYPNNKLYVNHHLSPVNKQFSARLEKISMEKGYTFVWCSKGKFYLRKAPGDKSYRINKMKD